MRIFSKQFFLAFIISCLASALAAYAATVTSISETTAIDFGIITPGTSTGTAATDGTTTGGVKILSGNVIGSFSVNAVNTDSSSNGRAVRIFLDPRPTKFDGTSQGVLNLNITITSPLPTDCIKTSSNKTITCTNPNTTVGHVKTWTIPIYGGISSISTTQDSADYSATYGMVACACCVKKTPAECRNNGCPSNTGNYRCTSSKLSKSITGLTIPVTIYKSLSVVAGTDLNFGSVAPGEVAGSTIDQAGNVTGGATAVGGARSAGTFTVSGEPNDGTQYSFTLPENVTLRKNGNAPDMTAHLSYSAGTGSRTLNTSGQDVVTINGTLTMGARAEQTAGEYVGTYDITVNY